jgi:hypothetical protein
MSSVTQQLGGKPRQFNTCLLNPTISYRALDADLFCSQGCSSHHTAVGALSERAKRTILAKSQPTNTNTSFSLGRATEPPQLLCSWFAVKTEAVEGGGN